MMKAVSSAGAEERLPGRADSVSGYQYVRIGRGAEGIERMEARFTGRPFSPHRPDRYAVGVTKAGLQTFRYRGVQRYCGPGRCHVLHPDETHDGASATEAGFAYRIAYIDPALVQEALGGRPLPFVEEPVVALTSAQWAGIQRMWDMDDEIDELGRLEIAISLADTLELLSTSKVRRPPVLPLSALDRARELLVSNPARKRSARELEREAGLDRFTLARGFRAAFGTSPSRFRTQRQLDLVRRFLRSGSSCADAALQAGFSDQSHMTRMFKRAYGLTPAGWTALSKRSSPAPMQ
jgi:AraC-like DNA-binding protein